MEVRSLFVIDDFCQLTWVANNFHLLYDNKKHLKNVGPIRYCEPPHAHPPAVSYTHLTLPTILRV